ncbi:MAG: zf-HC2 domain-containing protein [Terracidiphilus sp.]|jgi:hypothetical protein
MTERTFIPASPACGQWETLLADALDGLLKPEDEATFAAHMTACPACTELFEEARRGREWLEFLSPEPEVPAGLLERLLARTGPGQAADYTFATGSGNVVPIHPAMIPSWQRPGILGYVRRFAEPRLLMTAAMAFFSIAMTLNMTGVRLRDLRLSNLRPNAVRSFMERRLTMASTPIIRYYDHLRLVYEVQTRMRELRKTTGGEGDSDRQQPHDSSPGESKEAPANKDGGSRMDPPQQSGSPALEPAVEPTLNDSDFLETSLKLQHRPAHSGGSRREIRERSTVWTA